MTAARKESDSWSQTFYKPLHFDGRFSGERRADDS
jgi:hypothetical protein